ncbi:DUF6998 domain-containing protein [Nonlabens sp. Asnod2-A12]|uniref:DUF6998 domain-containing protein n=1 Tax=Nonlabens sp. Asnod2-A12 TaxID=3160578 RepID=UPI00386C1C97
MKEIQQLQDIVASLNKQYNEVTNDNEDDHKPKFTLDGKLVGDIGEVIAAKAYGLRLFRANKHRYDGCVIGDEEKKVQIKSTIKGHIYFPQNKDKTPRYFLAILINEGGTFEELYNGTGGFIWENYLLNGNRNLKAKHPFKLSLNKLRMLNQAKTNIDKIIRIDD